MASFHVAIGNYVNRTTQIENSFIITERSVGPGCLKSELRDFPGGPVQGVDPWPGHCILHATTKRPCMLQLRPGQRMNTYLKSDWRGGTARWVGLWSLDVDSVSTPAPPLPSCVVLTSSFHPRCLDPLACKMQMLMAPTFKSCGKD